MWCRARSSATSAHCIEGARGRVASSVNTELVHGSVNARVVADDHDLDEVSADKEVFDSSVLNEDEDIDGNRVFSGQINATALAAALK